MRGTLDQFKGDFRLFSERRSHNVKQGEGSPQYKFIKVDFILFSESQKLFNRTKSLVPNVLSFYIILYSNNFSISDYNQLWKLFTVRGPLDQFKGDFRLFSERRSHNVKQGEGSPRFKFIKVDFILCPECRSHNTIISIVLYINP